MQRFRLNLWINSTFGTHQYGTIAFPRKKFLKLKKYLNFFSSPNVSPKPTIQSRSNSIYRVLLQVSLIRIFVFDLALKLRVVHIRKKIKFLSQRWLQLI